MLEGPHTPAHLPNATVENISAHDLVIAISFVNEREETLNLGQPHHILDSSKVQEI